MRQAGALLQGHWWLGDKGDFYLLVQYLLNIFLCCKTNIIFKKNPCGSAINIQTISIYFYPVAQPCDTGMGRKAAEIVKLGYITAVWQPSSLSPSSWPWFWSVKHQRKEIVCVCMYTYLCAMNVIVMASYTCVYMHMKPRGHPQVWFPRHCLSCYFETESSTSWGSPLG